MEGVYKRMGDPIMVDGRGKLMLGCRRLPGVWRGRLGGVPRTRPGRPYPAPHCLHRGGGSREPVGSTARLSRAPAQAHTYFTRAGDRRAVDAQTTHAAGKGHANQPRDGGSGSCTARNDAAAALGSGFLPAPPASQCARDQ